jgi:hypothetical protein
MVLAVMIAMMALAAAARADVLHVGPGRQYTDPRAACLQARPGDTVLLHAAQYRGAFFIENIAGTTRDPIVIRGESRDAVVFDGGSESMHFSDCSHLVIENFTVRGQTANGMNCDDGGSIETPAHHITFRDLTFAAMAATGNNDQLKLSGLDSFVVENCIFEDGSAGGSGVDMVGCHDGVFRNNTFRRQGSNCIQAKGGCRFLRIERNWFVDGGQRAVNLGGSTGLQFFRPLDAPFEAADILVVANVFIRSIAPIAYVGCVRVSVTNNTIIDPARWVIRILQETVDSSRFLPCGNNIFQNNLVVFRSSISRHVNIGSNTEPSSFTLRNNCWYNVDAPASSRPQEALLTETASLYGQDPLLRSYATGDVRPLPASPLRAAGYATTESAIDIDGKPFAQPPSIGAYEVDEATSVDEHAIQPTIRVTRTIGGSWIETAPSNLPKHVRVCNLLGGFVQSVVIAHTPQFVPTESGAFIVP